MFVCRTNDTIFCQSGIPKASMADIQDEAALEFWLKVWNNTVKKQKDNWVPYKDFLKKKQSLFRTVVYNPFLMTKEFDTQDKTTMLGDSILPLEFRNAGVRFMITGHNKVASITIVARNKHMMRKSVKVTTTYGKIDTTGIIEVVINTDVIIPEIPELQHLKMTSVSQVSLPWKSLNSNASLRSEHC